MKKSLIALAVLAAAGTASAQSSVTLFGVIDATVQIGRGSVADVTALGSGGYNTSRLGFRGTEDLGGGMSASFWLESDVLVDNGQGGATNINNQASGTGTPAAGTFNGRQGLMFNRRSTVSLAGGWGEVRLGRDYTPQFWNQVAFDPFGVVGVGNTLTFADIGGAAAVRAPTAVRASNSIGYFLPSNLGGFYGQAMYHMGENASNAGATEDDGSGYGFRLGYAAGPLNVAVGYGTTNYAAGDAKTVNIGAQWGFGFGRLMGQYQRESLGAVDSDSWLIGGLVPVGAGEIRAAYSQRETETGVAGAEPRARKLSLGYVHNLSKRTAVYTTVARVRNSGGAALALNGATTAANQSSTGFDLGVRHAF